MRTALRSVLTAVLTSTLAVTVVVPAYASDDSALVEGGTTTVALPGGGEAEFNTSDPAATGATVEVAPIEVEGATAETSDGEVIALEDGVSLVATTPAGEDLSAFEHQVTVVEATEDSPAYVSEFVPAIELTFPVDAADLEGVDLASLGVWSRESADDEWEWVPSAYDAELGAVVAHSDHLSEFTVMGAPTATTDPALPRIALDPDDALGRAVWNGRVYDELEFSYAVAQMVEQELELTCEADVIITRTDRNAFVSRTTRANIIRNFDADIAATLAFNVYNTPPGGGPARPWGSSGDGGPVLFAEGGDSADVSFANRLRSTLATYTRPSRRGVVTNHTWVPYSQLEDSAPVYAHAELLFLDHNYDWPIIKNDLETVADGVVASLLKQIDAMSGIACAEPVTLPEPPSQETKDQWRQLGENNYQIYGTDPVNLATGNYLASEDVFRLTGVGDQVIDLTLAYNALDGRASPVGNGWNFAYASRGQLYDNGAVSLILADGRTLFFESDGAGGFVAPPGALSVLAATTGGAVLTFRDHTSLEFAFDEDTGYGTLVRAVDRQGNAYELTYGPLAEAAESEIVFPPLTSITDEAGQTVAVASTPAGRITAFTHPDGRIWTLGYDTDGNLTSITDGASRTRTFTYNAAGLLTVVTGADGVAELTNEYDADNRVVRQTDGAGYVRELSYGEGRVTTLTDALGEVSTLHHNAKNQIVRAVDAEGGNTLTGYDENYHPSSNTDANGNGFTTTYDALGRVTSFTNALGETTSFEHNSVGDVVAITGPGANGGTITTRYVLNADGRPVETHHPDGSVTYATYDEHGDMLSSTDAKGNTAFFSYDARGNMIAQTDALGGVTSMTFDLANRMTATTDANGNTTSFEYDTADNLVRVVDALGGVTVSEYDVNDSLISRTDARGEVTTFEHNVNLQITAINQPDGSRIEYEYDAEHRLVAQVNEDGTRRTWERDGLGRATVMIDEAGGRWLTEYDAIGNPIASIDPTGARSEIAYDALARPVTYTDALGHTRTVTYNPAGLVATDTDELGRTVTYGYSDAGLLTEVTTPDGSSVFFTRDANGLIATATDARGNVETYTVDAIGRTVAVEDALGGVWGTAYDAVGNVISTTDPLGNVTTTEFDALNRAVAVIDAAGQTATYTYDAMGALTSVTNVGGSITTFDNDALGRTVAITYPDGSTATMEYNARGLLVSETDVRGQTSSYVYDPRGLRTVVTDAAGQDWVSTYDERGLTTTMTDPLGGTTAYSYDALGQVVALTDPVGASTQYAYDAAGQRTAITNALGDSTTYAYDVMGRVVSTTSPAGAVTVYGYDANGNTTSFVDALGDEITFAYDALDRLVVTTHPDGGNTTQTLDALGRMTAVTDPHGNTSTFDYDALGRAISSTDAAGFTTTGTYDARGLLVSETDARGGVTTSTYDELNRLVSRVNPEGDTTAYTYDPAGNVTTVTDAAGVVTRHAYDARGLLVATVENAVDGAAPSASVNVTTTVEYDAAGRLVTTTDPRGHTTTYTRDAAGRIVAETDALGQVTTTEVDVLGRPVVITAPDGSATATTYSADGFATEVAFPDQSVTYGYDALGNRTSMTDGLGTSTWEYDWASRATRTVDALGQENTYTYDLVGNEIQATYADGRVIEREYDARNLAISQTDANGTTTFSYDEAGALAGIQRPSGVQTAITRDLAGRVTGIVHTGQGVVGNTLPSGEVNPSSMAPGNAFGHCKDGGNGHPNQQPAGCSTQVLAFEYDYDTRGLVSARDVITDETTTATVYEHDALGRLTQSTTGGLVAEYGWDAASNLVFESVSDDLSTTKKRDGYTSAREVNALNQVVEIVTDPLALPASHTETTVMFYDVRGNRISEVTTTSTGNKTHTVSDVAYTYDGRDLLASTTGGDTELSYERDGAGRALHITQDGQARTRLYDGVAVVRDGDTSITRSASGAVLFETATTTTGQGKKQSTHTVTADVLTDVLGSAVATAEGGLIDADLALFGDFGDLLTAPDAVTVTGYTGHVQVANLLEFATRTYDIDTRVWLQDDAYRGTVVRASSLNRYAYVEGAPETYVDKLGFFRAAAALHAQQVAAAKAAYEKAKAAYEAAMEAKKSYYTSTVSIPGLQTMPRYVFDSLFDTQAELEGYVQHQIQRRQKLAAIERQWQAEQLQIQAEQDSLLMYQTTIQTVEVFKDPSFAVHTVLDVVGVIPGIGEIADGLNAAIYALEGDYTNAALSLAGMVPFAGAAVTGARVVKNAVKAANRVSDTTQVAVTTSRVTTTIPTSAATPPLSAMPTPKAPDLPTMKAPEAAPAVKAPDAEMGRKTPKPVEGDFGSAAHSFLDSGAPVRHSETATAIGSDPAVAINLERSQGVAGHDVIVHGTHLEDGAASFVVDGMPTNTNQIAEAILENPDYTPGTPIQLVTCHGACGLSTELGAALGGVDVIALEGKVLLDEVTGVIRPPVT